MKKIIFISTCLLFFFSEISLAQALEKTKKHGFSISFGVNRNFMYNSPQPIYDCFDGCITDSQSPRFSANVQASYLYLFSKSHGLKVGIGNSQYRIQESVRSFDGIGGYYFYTSNVKLEYIDFHLAYYLQLGKRWFIENQVMYDITLIGYYPVKNQGISYKGKIGYLIPFSKTIDLTANAFYKSAISNYSEVYDFYPYSYGIDLGCLFRF